MLPQLGGGENSTFWVIPGELTQAIKSVTEAFGDHAASQLPLPKQDTGEPPAKADDNTRELTDGKNGRDASTAALEAAEQAAAAVDEAKSQVAAAERNSLTQR